MHLAMEGAARAAAATAGPTALPQAGPAGRPSAGPHSSLLPRVRRTGRCSLEAAVAHGRPQLQLQRLPARVNQLR